MTIRTLDDLLQAHGRGQAPDYLFFWGHRGAKACLSQWFEAAFVVDGLSYASAEHFMMAGKARLFGDDASLRNILAAATPSQAKSLGRAVTGYDEAAWRQHRGEIVRAGNLAKFSQHEALRDYLLSTGDQVLVEASPVDAVWGIGLAHDHPHAPHPPRWPGLNLLGFALMQVREELRACPRWERTGR
ncbi:MAG: NADAR family protein [Aquabacterium sp.]|jgi:ribA/ribD-fused uncharacterized protein|nr:MAG: NADAR family protein [Aquabacterium sp.]